MYAVNLVGHGFSQPKCHFLNSKILGQPQEIYLPVQTNLSGAKLLRRFFPTAREYLGRTSGVVFENFLYLAPSSSFDQFGFAGESGNF